MSQPKAPTRMMKEHKQTYGLIANHTQTLWWVGEAFDPEEACGLSDLVTGGESFEYVPHEQLQPEEVGYVVHQVPTGFSVEGLDVDSAVTAVRRYPIVGRFARVDI